MSRLDDSKTCKVLVVLLATIYLLAGAAAFIAAILDKNHVAGHLYNKLLGVGALQILLGTAFLVAFVLLSLRKRFAHVMTGVAVFITIPVCLKTIGNSLMSGLQSEALVESVLILPAIAYLIFCIIKPTEP
jgi:hypothetical protein